MRYYLVPPIGILDWVEIPEVSREGIVKLGGADRDIPYRRLMAHVPQGWKDVPLLVREDICMSPLVRKMDPGA